MVSRHAVLWQCEFPPQDAIERYEAIVPGTFARILAMSEQLQTARIESARRQEMAHRDVRRGHLLAGSVLILAMLAASVTAYLGHDWVAAAFLALPVMSVANSFVDGARGVKSPQPGHDDREP
jgi:uncharacterized membrane protein